MTASGWRRVVGIAWGVLFLAACGENADLFSSLDEQAEPELYTLQAGSVMSDEDPFEVQIEYPSDEASRATSMRVELRDTEGTVYGTVEFDQTDLAEPRLPAVEFSEPPDGVYVLVTEAWINDQLLFSDRRQVFVASEPPRIESVTIHPTSIRREMQALAVAEVDYAINTRPYLRWIFDGGVAAEGYLEDGLHRTILDGGGRSAGAYRVSLEVYPWGVDERTVIDGSTTITAESDVVVREELEPESPDFALRSPGTVVRYFSFDGTRQAWSDPSTEPVEASVEGEVFLDMISGALGVRVPAPGAITAPVPTPDEPDFVHLVALRLSATGPVYRSASDSVISFAAAGVSGEAVPITIENGRFVMHPPGASPMPLPLAPEERELVTLQFLLRNENGDTFLEPVSDDGAPAGSIRLGSGVREVSVAVHGHGDYQMFLDRITVTELSHGELQTDLVGRATRRFVESFDQALGAWAVMAPDAGAAMPLFPEEYPDPADAIEVDVDDSPFVHVQLPDRGAVVLYGEDGSAGSVILRRRGDVLELSSQQSPEGSISQVDISQVDISQVDISQVDISDAAGRFVLHRLELLRGTTENDSLESADIRMAEDDRGRYVALLLPATLRNSPITIVPEVADSDYPVWVGRWAR